MLIVAPPPVRIWPALAKEALVQVVVPAVFRVRPPVRSLTTVPLRVRAPFRVVVPASVMVPPVQVVGPETVRVWVPPRVPPERPSVVALAPPVLLKLIRPLLMVSVVVLIAWALLKVPVPPGAPPVAVSVGPTPVTVPVKVVVPSENVVLSAAV